MKSSTESCCLPSVAVHNLGQWGPSTYGRCIKFYVIIGSDRSTRWILGKLMDIFGERRRWRREETKSRLSRRLFPVRSRQDFRNFQSRQSIFVADGWESKGDLAKVSVPPSGPRSIDGISGSVGHAGHMIQTSRSLQWEHRWPRPC